MKKLTLCAILVICFSMLAGCKREEIVIKVEDVQTNTVLVKNDRTVQAATVEAFDKQYYNLSELNNFIIEQMNKYNSEVGEEAITLNSLEQKDGNAVLILNYTSLEHYQQFNKVETTLASMTSAQNGEITIPDVFISAKDGSYISKDVALKNSKYNVLVLNENTDVIVDGSIKYYTNAVLVSSSKLQTGTEGETIVIYKP